MNVPTVLSCVFPVGSQFLSAKQRRFPVFCGFAVIGQSRKNWTIRRIFGWDWEH
jgi:hypothetical protein